MIGSATSLILEALAKAGYEFAPPTAMLDFGIPRSVLYPDSTTDEAFFYSKNPPQLHTNPQFDTINAGYQIPPVYNFNPAGFQVSSETLEALSSLEPVDVTFEGRHDWLR